MKEKEKEELSVIEKPGASFFLLFHLFIFFSTYTLLASTQELIWFHSWRSKGSKEVSRQEAGIWLGGRSTWVLFSLSFSGFWAGVGNLTLTIYQPGYWNTMLIFPNKKATWYPIEPLEYQLIWGIYVPIWVYIYQYSTNLARWNVSDSANTYFENNVLGLDARWQPKTITLFNSSSEFKMQSKCLPEMQSIKISSFKCIRFVLCYFELGCRKKHGVRGYLGIPLKLVHTVHYKRK